MDPTQNEGVECDVCQRHFAKRAHWMTHKRFGTKCIPPGQQIAEERSGSSLRSINLPQRVARGSTSSSGSINQRTTRSQSSAGLNNQHSSQQPGSPEGLSSGSDGYHTPEYQFPNDQFPDDFSILDDRDYRDLPAPEFDLFQTDENEPPREDGRSQRMIDYCASLMANRNQAPPQPNIMEKIFFASIQFAALFLYVGAKYAFIYCLGLAFFYCSQDQCGSLMNYYVVDIAK